jgi:hypothetical protein
VNSHDHNLGDYDVELESFLSGVALAVRWEKSLGTVHRWRKIARDFPAPATNNRHIVLWRQADIERFEQTATFKALIATGTVPLVEENV